MAKKWKRPTKIEIERIRTECYQNGISKERAEKLIADARRSPAEAEKQSKEAVAQWEAEDEARPKRQPEELRSWYDELRGFRPPRKLPPEAAVYLPNWIHDFRKRKPFAPTPWFWIEPHHEGSVSWDGRCFVSGGGWEEIDPHPRGHHDAWELALLYPSAAECLEAAVQLSSDSGTLCAVCAYPPAAYFPPWDTSEGVVLDLQHLKWWVHLLVQTANTHYNAKLDPQTPINELIERGYLPSGTVYPVNGLSFWFHDSTKRLWDLLQRDFAPPTYFEIISRRDCRQDC